MNPKREARKAWQKETGCKQSHKCTKSQARCYEARNILFNCFTPCESDQCELCCPDKRKDCAK